MANIIAKIKELIAIYKAISDIQSILQSVAPELKGDVMKLATDIDDVISKFQASPNVVDDNLVPALQAISAWLKKISA